VPEGEDELALDEAERSCELALDDYGVSFFAGDPLFDLVEDFIEGEPEELAEDHLVKIGAH